MRAPGVTALLAVAIAAGAGAGCGPIEYVNQVTRKASTAVSSAKAAEPDRYSPYHYTRAVEYLHKAREEAAAADFQAANRFGKRAEEAATLAKQEAIANAGKPIENFYPGFKPPGDAQPGKAGGGVAPLEEAPADEAPVDKTDGEDEVPAELGGKKK